jgi:hypothetical protein
VVVTCNDGPAARKNGTRDGSRYDRKEKLLLEIWVLRWFAIDVVGVGAFRSVDRHRSLKY